MVNLNITIFVRKGDNSGIFIQSRNMWQNKQRILANLV